MNEYRPNSAESQHNFHILPHFNSKTTESIFTIFTRCRGISAAIKAFIRKTIVHLVTARRLAKRGICRRRVSVCLCVCVSVTLRYCIQTAKRRITQTTPHDSPMTLVF